MQNLSTLIRTVRISQGIPQSKLAEYLGISQASIAKYETTKSTLSLDTLVRAADFLNLNPVYIEKGLGNPFKASDPSKAIKMFIPETLGGEADLELLDFILQSSEYTILLMLKPENRREFRWRDQSFSLLVGDKEGNRFILRRKNADSTFSDRQIQSLARKASKISNGFCEMKSQGVDDSVYEKIRKWSDLDSKAIEQILEERQRYKNFEDRSFFATVLNKMLQHSPPGEHRRSIDLLIEDYAKLRPDQYEPVLKRILPQFEKTMKNEISDVLS